MAGLWRWWTESWRPARQARLLYIVMGLGFGALAVAACRGGNGAPEEEAGLCPSKTPAAVEMEGELTPEELTDRVAEAITCPGYAFHFRSVGEYEAGPYSTDVEIDVWIDIENNVARTERVWRATSAEALREAEEAGFDEDAAALDTTIIHVDASYSSRELIGYPDEEDQDPVARRGPPNCHGPGREALAALIFCEGPLEDFETTIERHVSYRGQPAIALVNEGESSGSDETYFTTNRLYFDRDTVLPIGFTQEGTLDIGDIYPVHTDILYQYGFVSLDSLPADFFDPAAIGYVGKDPEEPLESAEIAVYWLGSAFEGSGKYPALGLRHATARPRAQTPEFGSIAQIAYCGAEDEFGRILVRIEMYPPEAWEFREQETRLNPCEETVDLDMPDGQATIRRHHHGRAQNPDDSCNPPDRFSAAVHFDGVVVAIDAPSTGGGRETFRSPYNSEEAMELLVRSLVLRE
ncbi:MAG: hypothetical protein IH866_02330 [Chloroflexi bacterium]|nr:hypothetical protein [Chloroflexota bacterium]